MSTELEKITGKVAEIVSDRELILNRGAEHGITRGMYFNILDPSSIGIKDPDTGEDLGGIKRIKITVVAVEVAARITLAQTFRTKTVNIGGSGMMAGYTNMFASPKIVEKAETLRLDPDGPKPMGASESVVSKGDPFESGDAADANAARSVTIWK